jgi:hypothetical protein
MVLRVDLHMHPAATCGLSTYIRHQKPIETVVVFNISMQEKKMQRGFSLSWRRTFEPRSYRNQCHRVGDGGKGPRLPCFQRVQPMPWGVSGFSAAIGCM